MTKSITTISILPIVEKNHQSLSEYTSRNFNENATIIITIHNFMGTIIRNGELKQPNGRWVLFEPERPADKILDPVLLPLIQSAVKEIFTVDAAYRKVTPLQFTEDEWNKGKIRSLNKDNQIQWG